MKKSPLSTPSGSMGKERYNRRSYDHKSTTGYNFDKSDNFQCLSPNSRRQMHCGNDFIPLNVSTPVLEHKRFSNNWHGSGGNRNYRNSGSGGFNHYRNNYHATPKSNFNNSYSPYKHSGKQFYGQKKGYHKDAQKYVNISNYIDMKSFLEDPWAELVKKLNRSEGANEEKSLKHEQLLPVQSVCVNSETDFEDKSVIDEDFCFSQESKNDSPMNVLGLDDADVSSISRTESSIDLKLDNVRFSQESKDKSICSDTTCEDILEENSVHHACDSQTNSIEVM
ncbi:uncharacterized protein LOC143178190 [Calliopsis andreniformis]|uniref:uncharacterized protein LOC143178190 n=1 Tax=Calliopsis andreniformis TaxID=337506 RepID=UPI003FCC8B0C